MSSRALRIGLLSLLFSSLRVAAADNWPHWRGPQGAGVAPAGDYPIKFSRDDGVAWKIEAPGRGMSTPAVWDDRIFFTAGVDGQDTVCAYDFTGREIWKKPLSPEKKGKHGNGSGSNPSPATDGSHVVVYFKSGTLACLNPAGEVLWQKNLQQEYGKDTLWWDLGTSPVLAGDKVVIAVIQAGDSFLAAFRLDSGELAWK